MARVIQLIALSLLVAVDLCCGIGVFDRVLDDITSCVDTCTNTYSPHTYEKGYLVDACKRGCRFFSIMEFVYCNHNSLNLTQQGCKASCEEAYNKTEELESCKFGCNSQIPHVIEQQKEDELLQPNIHILYPFMYIHSMYSNMVDKMYHGMSVRWSFYMQGDNGKVVIVKSQPQLYAEIDNVPLDDEYNTANYLETNLEPLDRSATPDLPFSQLSGFHDNTERELSLDTVERQTSSDWLSCVSKKTGIPREFLSLLLLASAIMMIWLCLSALATSPDHWVKAEPQKLSINGDLEYLRELEMKGLKLSFPQEVEEAGPLPIKIQVHRI